MGVKNDFGELQNEISGKCGYGIFGYAQFSNPQFPYASIGHISDGQNFIFATFICSIAPDRRHVDDVVNILISIKKNLGWHPCLDDSGSNPVNPIKSINRVQQISPMNYFNGLPHYNYFPLRK
ncbi:hypothetical protein [Mucilaginibacter sp. OK283]|uniref:hypothetical protein n=1 Tax=Mucilaginibacter sp. OK283 TaxID=1881049 RepID=UPI000B853EC8|nr:hypothetical protein [Mucilaginibacter sp. OK283]